MKEVAEVIARGGEGGCKTLGPRGQHMPAMHHNAELQQCNAYICAGNMQRFRFAKEDGTLTGSESATD
eukprot:363974-Chlamydomonas_euryale.AAC.19